MENLVKLGVKQKTWFGGEKGRQFECEYRIITLCILNNELGVKNNSVKSNKFANWKCEIDLNNRGFY